MTAIPLPDALDFSGRSVCVTGAASGIGRATADLFHRLGARVYAADRDAAALEALAAERPDISTVLYDQADLRSCERLFEEVRRVDVLIANAGVLLYEPLIDLKWDDMNRVVQVNLLGTMALTRLFGEAMVAQGKGAMVLTSSQLAFNGSEFRSVYAATKAAINQFVKTAALEWGPHGVRVNAVAPGRTLTVLNRHLLAEPTERAKALERVPAGRFGDPIDIANAMVFLSSDAASYVTGHTLVVDGGWILP
ncbi:SDR family oxidoreductase [soil metagenome]